MARLRFAPGIRVSIKGEFYRFVEREASGTWQMVGEATRKYEAFTKAQLDDLYLQGHLKAPPNQASTGDLAKLRHSKEEPLSHRSEAAQERYHVKTKLVRLVGEKTVPGTLHSEIEHGGKVITLLELALIEAAKELGTKKISEATYYRWRHDVTNDPGDGTLINGDFDKRGNRNQMDPLIKRIVKEVIAQLLLEAKDKNGLGKPPKLTTRRIRTKVLERLDAERALLGPEAKLALPSRWAIGRLYATFPAIDRAIARFGKQKARALFRQTLGHLEPEYCLQFCEFDECKLPFYFIDDYTKYGLGLGWLSWFIDRYSGLPTGLYLGFEPPSDLAIASALRSAILPKRYLTQEYPMIKGEWLAQGIPDNLTFDNSMAAHANSIRTICGDLVIPYDFNPPVTPWFKGKIESSFHAFNRRILDDLCGKTVYREIAIRDYNPAKNAIIGFRHFLAILYKFLVDVWAIVPHWESRMTCNERWIKGTQDVQPALLSSTDDLDLLFSIVREGRMVDHHGVVFESLPFFSEELQFVRRQIGHKTKVVIRLNPSNLSKIFVYEPHERAWLRVAINKRYEDYVKELTLHRHLLNRKYAAEKFSNDNYESLVRAESELIAMMQGAIHEDYGARIGALVARASGFGTDTFTHLLDANGEIIMPADAPSTKPQITPRQEAANNTLASITGGPGATMPTPPASRSETEEFVPDRSRIPLFASDIGQKRKRSA